MKKFILIFMAVILAVGGYIFFATPSYNQIDISDALLEVEKSLQDDQKIITFPSKNPFNFYDIFQNIAQVTEQEVYGILTTPIGEGPHPVIIGVAGSYGWADHHYGYMQRYLDIGFAVFTLHSFKSRGIKSTVGRQMSVTTAMVVYDAFMALKELSQHGNIDIQRAGITGWSLGGGVALFTAWKPIQEAISPNYQFSAHLPIYQPCMVKPEIMKYTNAPMHILIGELDDWVPAEPCVELINELQGLGYDADITVYPESHHSFDRDQEERRINIAYSFTDCRLTLSEDGNVRLINTEFPLSSPILQKIGLAFCAERGVTYGGNDYAREHSREFAKEFMGKYLLN